jgi:hypothetical protein
MRSAGSSESELAETFAGTELHVFRSRWPSVRPMRRVRGGWVVRSHRMKKPWFSPIGCFLGSLAGLILGTLVRRRALPFLRDETILSGGKLIPTTEWVEFASNFFYIGSAVTLIIGIIALVSLSDANRRYIAQLPRWQQYLIGRGSFRLWHPNDLTNRRANGPSAKWLCAFATTPCRGLSLFVRHESSRLRQLWLWKEHVRTSVRGTGGSPAPRSGLHRLGAGGARQDCCAATT